MVWMQADLAQYFNAVQFPESHLSVILVQTFTVQSLHLQKSVFLFPNISIFGEVLSFLLTQIHQN